MGNLLLEEQLAHIHLDELRREAERERRAHLAGAANGSVGPGWTRRLHDLVAALVAWHVVVPRVAIASGTEATRPSGTSERTRLTDEHACCAG